MKRNRFINLLILGFLFFNQSLFAGIGDSRGPFDSDNQTNENSNTSTIGQGISSLPFNTSQQEESILDLTPPGDPHDVVPIDKGFLFVFLIGTGMGLYFLKTKQINVLAKR